MSVLDALSWTLGVSGCIGNDVPMGSLLSPGKTQSTVMWFYQIVRNVIEISLGGFLDLYRVFSSKRISENYFYGNSMFFKFLVSFE